MSTLASDRFPSRARLWRLQRGLTQAELAERAGLSKRTIERIELSENGDVNLRHLVRLALALDCELIDLVDDAWLALGPYEAVALDVGRTSLGRSPGRGRPGWQRDRARPRDARLEGNLAS